MFVRAFLVLAAVLATTACADSRQPSTPDGGREPTDAGPGRAIRVAMDYLEHPGGSLEQCSSMDDLLCALIVRFDIPCEFNPAFGVSLDCDNGLQCRGNAGLFMTGPERTRVSGVGRCEIPDECDGSGGYDMWVNVAELEEHTGCELP